MCPTDFHSYGTVSPSPPGLFAGAIPVPPGLQGMGGAGRLHSHFHLEGAHLALESRRARREESEESSQDPSKHIYTIMHTFVGRKCPSSLPKYPQKGSKG